MASETLPSEPNGHANGRSHEAERRRELASFLRSRRERLAPEDVGLPPGLRRRTPGLRREEVAQLSAVGVTWYTWLEQGRPINASAQVLEAVARTLRLDPSERSHLFTLAAVADQSPPVVEACDPAVRELVEGMDPYPAMLLSPRYDILAWNRAHAALQGDYSTIPRRYRNVLRLAFTQPAWRERIVDQGDVAYIVARFRAASADHVGEPAWVELVEELRAVSAEFAELWDRHDVAGGTSHLKRFIHPELGVIRLNATSLTLADRPGVRLVAMTPADEQARAALTRLSELGPWRVDWSFPESAELEQPIAATG